MENFVKCMVEEHSQLVARTEALHAYVYSEKSNADNKVEFANKCVQLAAMEKYEEALRARIENQGIIFENGHYFEHVGCVHYQPKNPSPANPSNDEQSGTQSENAE